MSKLKMQGLEVLNQDEMIDIYHSNLIFWNEAYSKNQTKLADYFIDRVNDIEEVYVDKFGEHPDDYVSQS